MGVYQELLSGKNHRIGKSDIPLSGGLFRCAFCGQAMTGELIRKKLKTGEFNEHIYYRCANNHPDSDHPKVRWRAKDLEDAVTKDLQTLRLAPEYAAWFRKTLAAAFANIGETTARQQKTLQKRKSEVEGMQEKLLNAYLGGVVDQHVFEAKSLSE